MVPTQLHSEVISVSRHRPVSILVAALGALLFQLAAVAPALAAPPLPTSMASTGDSITRAFATRSGFFWFTDNPAASWSTGTDSSVDSQYSRILAQSSAISGNNANDAATGAVMADLAGQMQTVVGQHPDYVTVLMGANDLCTSTTAQMTSVTDFDTQFRAALATLQAGDPGALVFVASIPDVYHLWQILKDNSSARSAWSLYGVCQSLLANPLSTAQTDVARRALVQQRNVDYNAVLAQACSDYGANCRFDGNAVYDYGFTTSQVNTHDYFHPDIAGQAALAGVTWDASFWGSSTPADQPPTAAFSASCPDLTCTFTDQSSDPDGSVTGWSWSFGDSTGSTSQNPSHTYATGGSYTVSLTVTDNAGLTASTSQTINVSAGTTTITLTATRTTTVIHNKLQIDLAWSGSSAAQMDVYRNGSLLATTPNTGSYTDTVNAKKHATYTYQVCEAGTQICSNDSSVTN